jgi:hypothetical protein
MMDLLLPILQLNILILVMILLKGQEQSVYLQNVITLGLTLTVFFEQRESGRHVSPMMVMMMIR